MDSPGASKQPSSPSTPQQRPARVSAALAGTFRQGAKQKTLGLQMVLMSVGRFLANLLTRPQGCVETVWVRSLIGWETGLFGEHRQGISGSSFLFLFLSFCAASFLFGLFQVPPRG